MNRDMPQPSIVPNVVLIDLHAHQVRHDVGQSEVVIALHPHNFNLAFWIGELANRAKELPVCVLEATEIQVREDVPQENQPPEGILLEHAGGGTRTADFRAQMHVREDQRVIDRRFHALTYKLAMLQGYEKCTEISA